MRSKTLSPHLVSGKRLMCRTHCAWPNPVQLLVTVTEISDLFSIHLLDSRTSPTATTWRITAKATARHATRGHVTTSTGRLVHLHHDRVHHSLDLLLLRLELILLCQ